MKLRGSINVFGIDSVEGLKKSEDQNEGGSEETYGSDRRAEVSVDELGQPRLSPVITVLLDPHPDVIKTAIVGGSIGVGVLKKYNHLLVAGERAVQYALLPQQRHVLCLTEQRLHEVNEAYDAQFCGSIRRYLVRHEIREDGDVVGGDAEQGEVKAAVGKEGEEADVRQGGRAGLEMYAFRLQIRRGTELAIIQFPVIFWWPTISVNGT